MSFLTEVATRRIATAIPRVAAVPAPRTFTTSIAAQKSATETVKDGLKKVDRAVSDKVVDGIDMATAAADKVKKATEDVSGAEARAKAQELKGEAAGKAQELKGKAKGVAEETKGKAKGTAEEVKHNL